jgi:hypothetical protein
LAPINFLDGRVSQNESDISGQGTRITLLENTHPRIAKSKLESMQKKQCLKCIKWIQISPHKFMCDICENIFHT